MHPKAPGAYLAMSGALLILAAVLVPAIRAMFPNAPASVRFEADFSGGGGRWNTVSFTVPAGGRFSIWLGAAGRALEYRDFRIEGNVIDEAGKSVGGFRQDFRRGFERARFESKYLYRLGECALEAHDRARLAYRVSGEAPVPAGEIFFRREPPPYSPAASFATFLFGMLAVWLGIRTLMQSEAGGADRFRSGRSIRRGRIMVD
jgi:hypothetical protein